VGQRTAQDFNSMTGTTQASYASNVAWTAKKMTAVTSMTGASSSVSGWYLYGVAVNGTANPLWSGTAAKWGTNNGSSGTGVFLFTW
jgi:hypothetical protein